MYQNMIRTVCISSASWPVLHSVDGGLVEEERGGRLHPGGGEHDFSDDDFTGALLGPVAPASEAVVRNHVHEAGVDLQMFGASEDAPEMVEDAAGVPQLGEDFQGVVPHHVGGGRVEVVPVIVDPVLRREVHC
jgi:hypothetical protein